MKLLLALLIFFISVSCSFSSKSEDTIELEPKNSSVDTILIKIQNKIDKSYEIGFYEKSFTYCWVTGKDTLDFKIGLTKYVRNGSVNLILFHQRPILFSVAVAKINESLPLIEQDFNLDSLRRLHFKPPIFYKDLTTELSKIYKTEFGEENIRYQELSGFLSKSWLDKKLGLFLSELNLTTKRYDIEKFHFLNKENYKTYIPNENLNGYPSFSIHGMGVSVELEEEK